MSSSRRPVSASRPEDGFTPRKASGFHPGAGFTLIELLVVIAIISILASILFPAFATAREKGRQTVCLSNMRQIVMAFNMYATDYDEGFPGAAKAEGLPVCFPVRTNDWVLKQTISEQTRDCPPQAQPARNGALFSYVKNAQIYTCTSDRYKDSKTLSYSMNGRLSGTGLAAIQAPTSTVLLMDESSSLNDGYFEAPTVLPPPDAEGYLGIFYTERPTRQHNGGGNVAFADGHTKWRRPEQFKVGMFDPAVY